MRKALSLSVAIHMALAALVSSLRSSFMVPPQLVFVDLLESGVGEAPRQTARKPSLRPSLEKATQTMGNESSPALAKETASSASSGSSLAPGEGQAIRISAEQRFLASVRREIEKNKFYPPLARKLRQTGKVVITIRIAEDGSIVDSEVSEKSAFPILNSATETILRSVRKFDPIPAELGEKMKIVQLPINYHLE